MITVGDFSVVITKITGALVGHFRMYAVLDSVVDISMRTLHAEACSIWLEDKEHEPGVLTMMAGSGFARKLVGKAKYMLGEPSFTGTVAAYGQGFNIKSRAELENLKVDGNRVWRGKFDSCQWPSGQSEFRNCIALPLKIKDQVLGVIKVENKYSEYGSDFTENDVRSLETMANVVALAIENARLHEQIERQLRTIAAKAAHRINNQVTNYDGIELELLDYVESTESDKDRLRDIAIRIAETTKRLKRMVSEFRIYGKPLVIYKEMCDVNKLISDEIWLAKSSKHIRIDAKLDTNIPSVAIDAGRFAEAIKELLSNSIKAISKGNYKLGHIFISTHMFEERDSSAFQPMSSKKVAIEVCDDGPGFPAKFPLFLPFTSTDPQSTGLGLATVKELVEAHGGQIEAFNSPEGGAHIRIVLPLSI